jgi:hypothetical protein
VSGALQRAAGFFLAPPAAAERPEAATLPQAARAVVLGQAADATALAAALALSLRAAAGAPTALVAVWAPEAGAERAAATRAASRLAARLTAHELPATARGRLAWHALASEPAAAAAAVRRASAIVEGPLVTALTGARPAELEELVVEHDLAIVVADPGSPLARAALARLAVAGTACAPLGRGLPRRLALAGLAAPRLDLQSLVTGSGR